uniref:Cofactor assembly of complex C subunit B n=1 Tax=Paulinella chromatophora TaxID=39717 RepID=B1X527_PAUCH|nr:hypothetical protein PCC_0618 [Paulinella chromatophora]ACB43046.1 hypothetical protein PCC_0618 [Paulinella chromatophora]
MQYTIDFNEFKLILLRKEKRRQAHKILILDKYLKHFSMFSILNSTLLLALLLGVGLVFFLRAASKDRTTIVSIRSPKPPIEVLESIVNWLNQRGWQQEEADLEEKILRFRGTVSSSTGLTIFLSVLGSIGAGCLGLIILQFSPIFGWWPLTLVSLGPIAGIFYKTRAARPEQLEVQLISEDASEYSLLKLRAHRDELIALELELGPLLQLVSDGDLLTSPL